MTELLSELCCLIIEDLYGSFHAEIYKNLAFYGRLSCQQLGQKCRYSLKQMKAGLAALVQSRLVYHHSTPDGQSSYSPNLQNTYRLVRLGKLLRNVRHKHGSDAAAVLETLAYLGYASVDQVQHELFQQASAIQDAGKQQSRERLAGKAKHIIETLIHHNFIVRHRDFHGQNFHDARRDAESHLRLTGRLNIAKGKKGQAEADERIDNELAVRLDPGVPVHLIDFSTTNRKRPAEDDLEQPATKKARGVNGVLVNGGSGSSWHAQENTIYLCISYSTVVTNLRDEVLRQRTEKLLGKKLSNITSSMLVQLPRPNDFVDKSRLSIPNPTDEVLHLPDLLQIVNSTPRKHNHASTNGTTHHASVSNGHSHSADEHTLHTAQTALATLSEGPCPFLSYNIERDRWSISVSNLNTHLRELEILRLIAKRIENPPALRIIRMLISLGKLDEKMLQELGLLNAKELRQILALLQSMGLLELQEIPREPQRQPMRTMFLWFWDHERVTKVLLAELYKCMARLYQVLRKERGKIAGTLAKTERTDVRGREEEFLGAGELEVFRQWRRKEQWLVAEIERLDDSVILLRDL